MPTHTSNRVLYEEALPQGAVDLSSLKEESELISSSDSFNHMIFVIVFFISTSVFKAVKSDMEQLHPNQS